MTTGGGQGRGRGHVSEGRGRLNPEGGAVLSGQVAFLGEGASGGLALAW